MVNSSAVKSEDIAREEDEETLAATLSYMSQHRSDVLYAAKKMKMADSTRGR